MDLHWTRSQSPNTSSLMVSCDGGCHHPSEWGLDLGIAVEADSLAYQFNMMEVVVTQKAV